VALGVCVGADEDVSSAERSYFAAVQNDAPDQEVISFPVEFDGRANRHETRRLLKEGLFPKSNPLSRMSVQHLPGTMKFTKRNAFSIENT
jgi:hypothetical protein